MSETPSFTTLKVNEKGGPFLRDNKIIDCCCEEGFILVCDPTNPAHDRESWGLNCHSDVSWCVVKKADGTETYNDCAFDNFVRLTLEENMTITVKYSDNGPECQTGHRCDGATFKLYITRGSSKVFIANINLNNKTVPWDELSEITQGPFTITKEQIDALSAP